MASRKPKSDDTSTSSESEPPRELPFQHGAEVAVPVDDVDLPDNLPILPMRGAVFFPSTIMPLQIARESSQAMLDATLPQSKIIGLFTQRDPEIETPSLSDLYPVGVAGVVLKLIRHHDDTVTALVHGLRRVRMTAPIQDTPFLMAQTEVVKTTPGRGKRFQAYASRLRAMAKELVELTPGAHEHAMTMVLNIPDAGPLADYLASNIDLPVEERQSLLACANEAERVKKMHDVLANQLEMARLQQKIGEDVQKSINDTQRKFYLREHMRAIQEELGESEDSNQRVVDDLRKRLELAMPPEEVMAEALKELERLTIVPAASPEYSVILTYLEWIADLPWSKRSNEDIEIKKAREILDRDHFGLEKVKRRLTEFLAVRKLNPSGKGSILCLVGPPGVGKTSLGQSVADAMSREFSRLALGGVRDEAEIRGHRRTYIGAMPGRLIQAIKRAGTNNPVVLLDEVDKLASDMHGDPSSALLEVLDPRQNNAFVDRYLDVPFDLSRVLFICTANVADNIPPALYDRMEVIDLPGYTDLDKIQIAKRHLAKRQVIEHGLQVSKVRFKNEAISHVIEYYTREAGVRELERKIGGICRHLATRVAEDDMPPKGWSVDKKMVREILGPEKYFRETDVDSTPVGVVVGLAYTSVGGDILFIEAQRYPGKGELKITGQLGDVMRESVTAATTLLRMRGESLGLPEKPFDSWDVHIHVPAGAVPKDGPSAGGAMLCALVSMMTGVPLDKGLAMTGEITLRGKVLAIGGIKEKTLAAYRAGIRRVILPWDNRRDFEEIDVSVRKKLEFVFVKDVDELLCEAFRGTSLKLKRPK